MIASTETYFRALDSVADFSLEDPAIGTDEFDEMCEIISEIQDFEDQEYPIGDWSV